MWGCEKVDMFEMSGFVWNELAVGIEQSYCEGRNEDIITGCGLRYKLSERMDQSVMRWYEHIEKMSEERLEKRIYKAGVVKVGKEADGVLEVLIV